MSAFLGHNSAILYILKYLELGFFLKEKQKIVLVTL